MLEKYMTVYAGGSGEIVEKKSRFIANVALVHTEEEAIAFIDKMKKKYWDARHNCSAYVIGEHDEIVRCSDDGEPGGTAGRPMLDVLLGEGLKNTAVVVTRYFGGTLLGTGGLVRAYSKAVQEGLAGSTIIEKQLGRILWVTTDYVGIGKLQYLFGVESIPTLDSEYTDLVKLKILIPAARVGSMEKAITEATNGKARMQRDEEIYFAILDGKILTGEDLSQD
ncbi:MAG: YigZ family protein [Lachnospiraceae bacterium]|nr:YigZ family protein [Lachnospiraceae bacterium]